MRKCLFLLLFVCSLISLPAQTKSWKRGACMSNITEADMAALASGMTWFYDWGNAPGGAGTTASDKYNLEYCPMAWNAGWNADAIRNYVKNHPNCKYLLAYNEPNFREQANLTPTQAAADWPRLRAVANELGLKIIAPACNYSAWAEWGTPKKWLDAFFQLVPINEVDAIGLHCYMGSSAALIGYIKEYIGYYNKPIWLTEFCSWDDRHGTPDIAMRKIQREYLVETFDFLETEPMVARYAWFMAKTGENNAVPGFPWMQLLNGNNGILTENGKIFNTMSSYDEDFYHDTQSRIQANHYIRMKGIYMEETKDRDGIINVYDYNAGDYVDYNIDVPAAGDYYLFLRYSTASNAKIELSKDHAAIAELSLDLSGASSWATKRYAVSLSAGKQRLRLACTEGNSIKLNWLNLSQNADAETEEAGNPGGGDIGVNLAVDKPVEASSEQEFGNRLASFAVDGLIDEERWATEWEGDNPDNDRWFLVDLEAVYALKQITIYWEAAFATAYDIEASADKQNWTTIYSTTTGSGSIEEIPVSANARYVRIKCITRATQYGVSFYEFEVYGAEPSGVKDVEPSVPSVFLSQNILFLNHVASDAEVSLWDVNARPLFTGTNVDRIDLSSYSQGIYFVRIQTPEGDIHTMKVMKP